MKNMLLMLFPFIVLAVNLPIHGAGEPARKPEAPEWCRTLRNQVDAWVTGDAVMGAELMVMIDGTEALHEVWGWNDREDGVKLEKDRIFRLRSMTKPFVGTSILMLMEQGKLKLDDPVSKYLKSFDNPKSKTITIRDLLYHTSGFTMGYPKGSIDDYTNLEDAVADAAAQGPKYEPGKEYHYADADSAALGLIIRELTGMPPETFIHEKIFKPLDMNNTYCLLRKDRPDRKTVCSTYIWRDGKYVKFWDNEDPPETPFFRASGGVFGTMSDYAAFLKMWMDGGKHGKVRFLKEETVQKALTPGPVSPRYGMHWEIYHPASGDETMPVFGHGGSDGTVAIALPREHAMVFYFTQSRGTLSTMFLEKILLQALGYIEQKDIPDVTLNDETLNRYLGDFKMGKEVWTVKKSANGITYSVPRLVPLDFVPVSQTEFVHPVLDMGIRFEVKDDQCDSLIFRNGTAEVPAKRP